ncbi:MAG: hypothetical protein JWO31_322, partial [Phycisphaerales bacterium]|nr:hypothetical protein [Phycisphaerales bacterium]
MPIVVPCECGKQLRAPDAAAGRKGKCPGCGRVLLVPPAAQDPQASSAASSVAQPTRAPQTARVPQPVRNPQPVRTSQAARAVAPAEAPLRVRPEPSAAKAAPPPQSQFDEGPDDYGAYDVAA